MPLRVMGRFFGSTRRSYLAPNVRRSAEPLRSFVLFDGHDLLRVVELLPEHVIGQGGHQVDA